MAEWERTGHGAKACNATTTDFMIDIAGKPKSPWNVAAGRVFAEHLIEKMGYDDTQEMQKAIEKAFSNRVKSLQSRHKREELPLVERAIEKSRHSRQQRKYQLFQRRCSVAKIYDPLRKHLPFLDSLGPDGMSSDESAVEPSTNRLTYMVIKPDWRHPDLHSWLKVFDQLHHRHHIMNWGVDKHGALPHIRVGSQKIHYKLHAPPGLPINAYNPIWLDSREVLYLKHVLCPKEEPYTFGHPSNVIA
ncbi:hypothetical protein EDB85DRAFT_1877766 [Lactarius pseudohatsudake]|nr:hypothetical protein EDB85DRAFT_1877766 [Lactarius pseudohatsudake]